MQLSLALYNLLHYWDHLAQDAVQWHAVLIMGISLTS